MGLDETLCRLCDCINELDDIIQDIDALGGDVQMLDKARNIIFDV